MKFVCSLVAGIVLSTVCIAGIPKSTMVDPWVKPMLLKPGVHWIDFDGDGKKEKLVIQPKEESYTLRDALNPRSNPPICYIWEIYRTGLEPGIPRIDRDYYDKSMSDDPYWDGLTKFWLGKTIDGHRELLVLQQDPQKPSNAVQPIRILRFRYDPSIREPRTSQSGGMGLVGHLSSLTPYRPSDVISGRVKPQLWGRSETVAIEKQIVKQGITFFDRLHCSTPDKLDNWRPLSMTRFVSEGTYKGMGYLSLYCQSKKGEIAITITFKMNKKTHQLQPVSYGFCENKYTT